MSAEKLPPDGFVLGPGWNVIRGDVPILCDEHGRYHARYCHEDAREVIDRAVCVVFAEAMGAIVRKAEAPTRLPPEVVAAIHASAKAPPEQPSRNPLQLPAEAPVGELNPGEFKCGKCGKVHVNAAGGGVTFPIKITLCQRCWDDPGKGNRARIAALEAELAEAKQGMIAGLRTAIEVTAAAVQAERERCAAAFHRHWNSDDFCAADCEAEIRNGDPKP